jgi:UrcA family protein
MNTPKGITPIATTGASFVLLWAGAAMNNALAGAPLEAPRQQIVTAKDRGLTRSEHIGVLYHRIWAAAIYVCEPYNGNLGGKVAWDSCRDATIAYTVARFNVPALRDFYFAKISRQKPKFAAQLRGSLVDSTINGERT